jgi:hypothetical protein
MKIGDVMFDFHGISLEAGSADSAGCETRLYAARTFRRAYSTDMQTAHGR